MNKTIKILLITILSLFVVILTLVMIKLLNQKEINFDIITKKSILIHEKEYIDNFNSISVDTKSTDIYVKKSTDNEIKVKIYGNEKDKADSYIEDEKLIITKKEKNTSCFGICIYKQNKIELYLPEKINSKLIIKTSSGDVKVKNFSDLDSEITTTSGDIKISKLNSLNAYTTSGDIIINNANSLNASVTSGDVTIDNISNLNITTSSGDVVIKKFDIKSNSSIKTTSGDVLITSISDSYVDASSKSGDIGINNSNRYSQNELKIRTTSGDITVK